MIEINRWELDKLSESEYIELITKTKYDQKVYKPSEVPEFICKEYSNEEATE